MGSEEFLSATQTFNEELTVNMGCQMLPKEEKATYSQFHHDGNPYAYAYCDSLFVAACWKLAMLWKGFLGDSKQD
jgi:hypothetical protein